MPLPVNVNTVQVFGNFRELIDGDPRGVKVTYTPTYNGVVAGTDGATAVGLVGDPFTVEYLDGIVVQSLVCTNDPDLSPNPWGQWQITLYFGRRHALNRTFLITVPVGSAPINLVTVAAALPVPQAYTVVKTVNGTPPDPVTGDVEITATAGPHTHTLGDLPNTLATDTEVSNAVAAAVAALVASAPSTLDTFAELAAALGDDPNAVTTLTNLIATKVPLSVIVAAEDLIVGSGSGTVKRLPRGADGQVPTIVGGVLQYADPAGGAPAHRILRVADRSKQGAGDFYTMQDTASAWALLTSGPEYTIAAAAGEDIEVAYNILVGAATTSFTDLVVVTGGTPTIQRYLGSNSSTATFQGSAGNYTDGGGAALQGRVGVLGFVAGAGDIDTGTVRLRWAVKTNGTSGKIYANNNYPLILNVRNSRTPAA